MGSQANDAFIFACLPIIAFYVSLWVKAKGQDKKGIGALLFIFTISIVFWTIYNQNSTGLTIWAEKHTDRVVSEITAKLIGNIFPLQKVTDTPRLVNKVNEYFVNVKDASAIVRRDSIITITKNGEKIDTSKQVFGERLIIIHVDIDSKNVLVMGRIHTSTMFLKSSGHRVKDVKLINTELFQSINPLFIVLLTLIFVPLFDYLRKRGKEPTTATKFGMALFICRVICISNGLRHYVCSLHLWI